ncbi:Polysaccharide biosynthesis protein [Aliiroseovarius halocynthiae]|uniref:Oligosaccharide flippase family protein n=1 Tax=Aliiroseovarius halocynthiae TaxID=985055 RepID=A0A545SWP3_9RHOB|nr:oligosaccharide flippase family protein [Aliiroseovarius halocynthiae]TQV69387.1 oligosaccharide flippase family protein [Aliiroseovarius halocynthiae]SMR72776.1 Polysaccharide biosynthesis protein [Aliiroseovarius halocynthiae]
MTTTSQLSTLTKGLMAYGASEIAAKASRLFVVVAVARSLELAEIGMAAAAMAAGDIVKSLTENGVGQRIIAARKDMLQATCNTAHKIFWFWCIGLFTLQTSIAGVVFLTGGSTTLSALILFLAVEYLFMPGGLVQVALAMRAGKLRQTAAISGTQIVGTNLAAAALAVIWASPLALILPRVLSAPFWLIAQRRLHPWSSDSAAGHVPVGPFIHYGRAVLGTEVTKALRMQADKVIIGALMGPEILGLYFMAFNAGLSLANSVSVALATVVFPHLCNAQDKAEALRQSILLPLTVVAPIVTLQAMLAPFYVPVLFGDGWDAISPVVSILCLVAIPTTLWTATAGWLRAQNRPEVELWVTLALTAALLANATLLAPFGLTPVAAGYAIVTTAILLTASAPALQLAYGRTKQKA